MKQFKKGLSLLLALSLLLSLVYVGPVTHTHAASASSYISTTYAANLSVKTTKAVSLMEGPSTDATAAYTLAKDTMLTVKALHKNTSGTYWYEVLYYDITLYVDATATTLVDHLTGDVTVADLLSPAALGTGQGFPISGTISSTLNKLGKVTASVHYNSNIHKAPAITSSDTINGYSYSLKGSTVDNNMIYSDLAAGSYTHMLTVEAISYYINDSGALTTSTQTVVLDNKPLIVSTAYSNNPIVAKGIDVSVWNGDINWASVASQVDFAILRIGYEYTLDTKFTQNAAGCNANGIPFGVYIYSYAESEAEAIAEAEFVISALKNYDVDLPVFFDIEDECQSALGATAIQNIVKAFCETIKDAGYEPGLYTFLSWFNSYFGDSYYNSLPKWVAQIDGSTCAYAKGVTMWQYSWTGSFTGMSGDVDCNYYFGEFPGINSDTSYLSKCTYYPSNLDVTLTDSAEMRQYPSSDYTLLETLASGTKLHATGLYKNAYGNYWYQVEKDGVTGYIYYDSVSVDAYRYDDLSVVDPTMADLALNSGYYLKGQLKSIYNNMNKVNAKVYSGEDTLASPVLSSSASPNAKEYTLNYSEVCDNMIFSDLDTGYYTYEISADVRNYYVSDGSLSYEDENVVVWTAPFTVGGASIQPPESVVCNHNIVTDAAVAATCTTTGLTEGSHCSLCGIVFAEQTVVPASGHNYTSKIIAATCQDYERVAYTCSGCGDNYSVYADQTDWVETKPEGVDESKLETKQQYRYSDYEKITSNTANLAGYTQLSKTWESVGTSNLHYVKSWPSGFDTSHSVYTSYNKTPVSASETTTSKVVVNSSDELIGYVYYHWCYGTYTEGPINRTTSQTNDGTHTTFHSFVANISTIDPTTLTAASDGSVTYANANCCTDSWWWYYIPIYQQNYTTYKALFTYERWTDWSDWSDTAVTASDTRKVETRTVYRYINAELGDHNYVDGICTVCGESDTCQHPSHDTSGICASCGETVVHSYVDGVCSICGKNQVIPKIKPQYPAVSFDSEVLMNIFFYVEGMDGVALEDMGLLTWSVPQVNGTIDTAQKVIPGVQTMGDYYVASSAGIPAKKLGDTIYFKVYAKLDDGSYVYSSMLSTSPKAYALGRIKNSADEELKSLCVAMLNYGAAAQEYFGYKPYDLMNASLTDEQKAMVKAYDPAMVDDIPAVSSEKAGMFTRTAGGFNLMYPMVSFEGAFAINYYFTPAKEMDADLTLYYWGPNTFNSVSVMTPNNATASMTMIETEVAGQYWGDLTGIAAKQIDQVAYMAGVYQYDGAVYTTGVLPYSLGQYCKNIAAKESSDMRELAALTVVYGYYAEAYFY